MVNPSIAHAYNSIAPEYDAQLARNPVAVEMRKRLHAHFDRIFYSGNRALDFTAGTGGDALYLAGRGVAVTALDISSAMIAELERTATQCGLQIETHVLAAETIGTLRAENFDGAISTFAGLNTIDDLPRLAHDLALCLKPRGRLVVHALNQFCLWQSTTNLLHRRHARDTEMHIGAMSVPHQLFNPYALWHDVFAPHFELREVYALSIIAAPALAKRMPRWTPLLFRLDRVLGKLFPAVGDFFVMDLERRDEHARIES